MTVKRILLLAMFAAAGVGAAAVVVSRTSPGPSVYAASHQPEQTVDNVPRGTDCQPPAVQGQIGDLPHSAAEVSGLFRPVVSPAGPTYAEPHPLMGAQVRSESDDSRLRKLLEYLSQASGSAPAANAPEPPPPPAPAPAAPSAAEEEPREPSDTRTPPASIRAPPNAPANLSPPSGGTTLQVDPAEGDGRLTMNIQSDDIREVLDMLSEQGKMNILASPSVQGKVSAKLNGVDFESALEAILKSAGLVARRQGDFIFVGTPQDFTTLEQSLDSVGTRVYRPNYVSAAELQALIQALVTANIGVVSVSAPAEVGIQADADNAGGNKYAGGEVVLVKDYEGVLAQIDQVVAEVDVRPTQVAIEAMILSVKLDDEDKIGVNFALFKDNPHFRLGLGTPGTDLPASFADGGLQFAYLDGSVGAFVEALEAINDTNVIATPRLMVLNKHRAEIQIGKQDGYVSSTVTETSTSQKVEFLDTGTLLRLRPFVSDDGMIRMEVHPELSNGEVEVKGAFTLPWKEVTQVTTNVMVRDGCTMIIGGLLREQLTTTATQIPWLGNLPWAGVLFRSKEEKTERDEILVLITPHIVQEQPACDEGQLAACEYHRLQGVRAEKMSPLGKRHIARRYFRMAQNAWTAGDRDRALRFAELAVHFDPMNRAAVDLRSDIWMGRPGGDHALPAPAGERYSADGIDGAEMAPWLLDDLEGNLQTPAAPDAPMPPNESGAPARAKEIQRPGAWR